MVAENRTSRDAVGRGHDHGVPKAHLSVGAWPDGRCGERVAIAAWTLTAARKHDLSKHHRTTIPRNGAADCARRSYPSTLPGDSIFK